MSSYFFILLMYGLIYWFFTISLLDDGNRDDGTEGVLSSMLPHWRKANLAY